MLYRQRQRGNKSVYTRLCAGNISQPFSSAIAHIIALNKRVFALARAHDIPWQILQFAYKELVKQKIRKRKKTFGGSFHFCAYVRYFSRSPVRLQRFDGTVVPQMARTWAACFMSVASRAAYYSTSPA